MGRQIGSIEPNDGSRFLIGIDPGKTTGFAMLNEKTLEIKALYTTDFWELYGMLQISAKTLIPKVQIHIEQPASIKAVYSSHVQALIGTRQQTRDKLVCNIGENMREGTLLREGLRNLGYTIFDVRPIGKKKWTHEEFQTVTGWESSSNQHVRDAVRLVWDKKWQPTLPF
jgi:hypothetical protein